MNDPEISGATLMATTFGCHSDYLAIDCQAIILPVQLEIVKDDLTWWDVTHLYHMVTKDLQLNMCRIGLRQPPGSKVTESSFISLSPSGSWLFAGTAL